MWLDKQFRGCGLCNRGRWRDWVSLCLEVRHWVSWQLNQISMTSSFDCTRLTDHHFNVDYKKKKSNQYNYLTHPAYIFWPHLRMKLALPSILDIKSGPRAQMFPHLELQKEKHNLSVLRSVEKEAGREDVSVAAVTCRRCAPRCCSKMSVARECEDRLTETKTRTHIRKTWRKKKTWNE